MLQSFALSQWLMGILCPVILPATCVVSRALASATLPGVQAPIAGFLS